MRRRLTFRTRTLMLLTVFCAVSFGVYQIHERWVTYVRLANGWQAYQNFSAEWLADAESELREFQPKGPPCEGWSPLERKLTGEDLLDQRNDELTRISLETEIATYQALNDLCSRLAIKYQMAASRPWQYVPADTDVSTQLVADVLLASDPRYRPRNHFEPLGQHSTAGSSETPRRFQYLYYP